MVAEPSLREKIHPTYLRYYSTYVHPNRRLSVRAIVAAIFFYATEYFDVPDRSTISVFFSSCESDPYITGFRMTKIHHRTTGKIIIPFVGRTTPLLTVSNVCHPVKSLSGIDNKMWHIQTGSIPFWSVACSLNLFQAIPVRSSVVSIMFHYCHPQHIQAESFHHKRRCTNLLSPRATFSDFTVSGAIFPVPSWVGTIFVCCRLRWRSIYLCKAVDGSHGWNAGCHADDIRYNNYSFLGVYYGVPVRELFRLLMFQECILDTDTGQVVCLMWHIVILQASSWQDPEEYIK